MGLFGPSLSEVWSKFAREEGCQFIRGGFFAADKVIAQFWDWSITMDTYTETSTTNNSTTSTTYTRIRAPIANPSGLRFEIYRKGLFSDLGKALGMQDIPVGYQAFDDSFIIKGNDSHKIRQFLSNPLLRELIQGQREINLKLREDKSWFGERLPPGYSQLCFEDSQEIRDLNRLRSLFRLFAEALLQLDTVVNPGRMANHD